MHLGELLETLSAVRLWGYGEELGSHFSQTFTCEHHGPADDEGKARSQPVRKLQVKEERNDEVRDDFRQPRFADAGG